MLIHPEAYERYVAEMLTTPDDSIEHKLAAEIVALDDDALQTLLFAMYTQDPKGTAEFAVAVRLLSLLFAPAVQS
ncbi:hypothetical protein [Nocardia sp. NPDC051463]|uniref:hypothetical protein n=1 Tax=Nocardia sp. NPDC051463 TaxID=3154845 RepID=UPI00344BD5C6